MDMVAPQPWGVEAMKGVYIIKLAGVWLIWR